MAEKLTKIVVEDIDGKEYEVSGGSGGSAERPAPNSVGSAEIEDEGVKQEDLDKSIQDKLDLIDESNVVSEQDIEDDWKEAMRKAGLQLE